MEISEIKKLLAMATAQIEVSQLQRKRVEKMIEANDGWGSEEASNLEAKCDKLLTRAHKLIGKAYRDMESYLSECNIPTDEETPETDTETPSEER